jgi:transposase-like protein
VVISDQHAGKVAGLRRSFQGASHQRCPLHFTRNLLALVPKSHTGPSQAEHASEWESQTQVRRLCRACRAIDAYCGRCRARLASVVLLKEMGCPNPPAVGLVCLRHVRTWASPKAASCF